MKMILICKEKCGFIIFLDLWCTDTSPNIECLASYKLQMSYFYFIIFPFYNSADEEVIKAKQTPVQLEILKHILNYLNISISE